MLPGGLWEKNLKAGSPMKQLLVVSAALSVLALDWRTFPQRGAALAVSGRADKGPVQPSKQEKVPVAKESAWTWGYFFAAPDKASVQGLAGERKQSLSLYKVHSIVPVRGKPGVSIK